ncbi:NADH-quinone oxidoreductase subunit J [Verrucomicrobia bacterium]|nr:NADH-quinone oxidoreductase subunit J [Verrucomicrobiota bacterium]MDA7627121.1 NADH-quinone oxidoreductase subunit J [Verrucomicrobiota bacterium]MDA7652679.1 NADH-quinone oxidoreductase subunit J [bacterium]MDA7660451.1 NADH-quinone oxidoreductase subunit J [Verrucomicrobiota bacterium]MDA7669434.1 NADH-quinone oxidoreductase subunit J [bacterium]
MEALLFYIFSALTLVCGFLVVANPFTRNPVTSAMFLVLTIISMAGLFVLLNAFFLAAVQIMVYAGAVIVLFLFVIMLLDINEVEKQPVNYFSVTVGMLALLSIGGVLIKAILTSGVGDGLEAVTVGSTKKLGLSLFTDYVLPFEIMGVLLLVGMIGVILLSKKTLR